MVEIVGGCALIAFAMLWRVRISAVVVIHIDR